MVTEFVLMGFVCLFALSFTFLLIEHFRSEKRCREIDRLNLKSERQTKDASKRITELEEAIADGGIKILELQGELNEAEDNRNALLNLNAELKKELDLETAACKELDAQIKVLGQELQGAHEWINELVGRLERVRTECDRPYQVIQPGSINYLKEGETIQP